MDGDLVQRSKAIGFCYINSTMFFFMYANLNKSPAYGMSTELTMPTYNKDMDKASTCCLATHYYAIYSLPVTAISDSYIISMSSQKLKRSYVKVGRIQLLSQKFLSQRVSKSGSAGQTGKKKSSKQPGDAFQVSSLPQAWKQEGVSPSFKDQETKKVLWPNKQV
ncbi:uncharacterized protein LOC110433181 isoform X2 [Sorghum bicolor]|nr:uncharacterized protein LOC110433181 isoform X2 [Sorghum bicolor]XP_021310622.1 uncharacterized protein LOC110433181 isoform X2 [Sorghum bicolor]|eukprot:XP_021310621.1 uncharacterized protein LOC110433181 isoform X2 [Sorghum bicolor]